MTLTNSIRSIIFPPHCTVCGTPGAWTCDKCRNLLLVRTPPECFICRKISPGYETHYTCRTQTAISRTVICWRYNELAKILMQKMKYRTRYDISRHLSELAKDILQPWIPDGAILIPVPTSSLRIRERGFNQSNLIARNISDHCATPANLLPVHDILRKDPSSKSQATKKRKERQTLSKKEFSVENVPINSIIHRPVILIDDVCTTGTTLLRCSEVLSDAGFKNISAIALFRGKPRYGKSIYKRNT